MQKDLTGGNREVGGGYERGKNIIARSAHAGQEWAGSEGKKVVRSLVTAGLASLALCFGAVAQDCVVLVGAFTSKGPQDYAFSGGISADTYDTISECNVALLSKWNAALDLFGAQGMEGTDSFTVACVIPAACSPADEGEIKPENRTIFPFIVKNLRP